MSRGRKDRGMALLLVLWGVALMAVLAAAFATQTGLEARRLANVTAAARAHALLESGVAAAVLALTPAQPVWRTDGTAYPVVLSDARLTVRVFAETGRIDLNKSPEPLLRGLLRAATGDEKQAEALLGALLRRGGRSSEGANVLATGAAPSGGGRPFLAVRELAGLPGMTAAVYGKIAPSLTVYNPGGALDWRTAGRTALAALLSPEEAAALVENRRQSGYTPDPQLAARLGATGDGAARKGEVYTMRVSIDSPPGASSPGGGQALAGSLEAVVWLVAEGPVPYRILDWREPAVDGGAGDSP